MSAVCCNTVTRLLHEQSIAHAISMKGSTAAMNDDDVIAATQQTTKGRPGDPWWNPPAVTDFQPVTPTEAAAEALQET